MCVPAIGYSPSLETMPDKAVSIFNYGASNGKLIGSIWAQSLAGGCDYQQYFSEVRYGGYYQMPLDYLHKVELLSFERIGPAKKRPVGDQLTPSYVAGFF